MKYKLISLTNILTVGLVLSCTNVFAQDSSSPGAKNNGYNGGFNGYNGFNGNSNPVCQQLVNKDGSDSPALKNIKAQCDADNPNNAIASIKCVADATAFCNSSGSSSQNSCADDLNKFNDANNKFNEACDDGGLGNRSACLAANEQCDKCYGDTNNPSCGGTTLSGSAQRAQNALARTLSPDAKKATQNSNAIQQQIKSCPILAATFATTYKTKTDDEKTQLDADRTKVAQDQTNVNSDNSQLKDAALGYQKSVEAMQENEQDQMKGDQKDFQADKDKITQAQQNITADTNLHSQKASQYQLDCYNTAAASLKTSLNQVQTAINSSTYSTNSLTGLLNTNPLTQRLSALGGQLFQLCLSQMDYQNKMAANDQDFQADVAKQQQSISDATSDEQTILKTQMPQDQSNFGNKMALAQQQYNNDQTTLTQKLRTDNQTLAQNQADEQAEEAQYSADMKILKAAQDANSTAASSDNNSNHVSSKYDTLVQAAGEYIGSCCKNAIDPATNKVKSDAPSGCAQAIDINCGTAEAKPDCHLNTPKNGKSSNHQSTQ